MRFLVAILIIWLFLFYNIERLWPEIDLTDVAYTFVSVTVVVVMLIPRLRKLPVWVLVAATMPVFLVAKAWVKSSAWGASFPLTVTEVCAIALTTILARWVSIAVSEFESAVTRISIGQVDKLPESSSVGQAKMYQEVRRARNYERPLVLLAVGVEEKSFDVALDRMVQEVQHTMIKQYVLSSVSKTLCSELEDYNTIAQSNDHFLVLLPEVTRDKLPELTERLRKLVSEQVGITLKIGAASIPGDAVTFEGLVEKAAQEMNAKLEPRPQLASQSQRLSIEHTAT
jgi:GGDEF domain-containing protein